MDEWIRDPQALDAVFALNALQPGDEVELADHASVNVRWPGHRLRLVGRGEDVRYWQYEVLTPDAPQPQGYVGDHYDARRETVVAWRRPCQK